MVASRYAYDARLEDVTLHTRKDGRHVIVQIKAERAREHPVAREKGRKAMAIRRWQNLNPDRLRYEMIFTDSESVGFNQLEPLREFIKERPRKGPGR